MSLSKKKITKLLSEFKKSWDIPDDNEEILNSDVHELLGKVVNLLKNADEISMYEARELLDVCRNGSGLSAFIQNN